MSDSTLTVKTTHPFNQISLWFVIRKKYEKIANGKNCNGVPDMVVEILSPSTAIRDQNIKFDQYLEAGVKEYWIVDPDTRKVRVYMFEKEKVTFQIYNETDTISVYIIENCRVNLSTVFPANTTGEEKENSEPPSDGST